VVLALFCGLANRMCALQTWARLPLIRFALRYRQYRCHTGRASIPVRTPRSYQYNSLVSRTYQYSVRVPVLIKNFLGLRPTGSIVALRATSGTITAACFKYVNGQR
jgi:hypothetical protein